MDMKCNKCLEPWDWWHIRDFVLEDQALYDTAAKKGLIATDEDGGKWQFGQGPCIDQCPACFGKKVERTEAQETRSQIQMALQDMLGDDIDGIMAEMEDLEGLF